LQVPEGTSLSEAVFHIDTFNKGPEGENQEELIILLNNTASSDEDKSLITIIDVKLNMEELGQQATVMLDSTL